MTFNRIFYYSLFQKMEQEKSRKKREKKGPGTTIPDAPTLQDFYIDTCSRLEENPGGEKCDIDGSRLTEGVDNVELDDGVKFEDNHITDQDGSRCRNTETSNNDPEDYLSPLSSSERRPTENFESSAPELEDIIESSAPPMDLDMLQIENSRENSAPPLEEGANDFRQLNTDLKRFAPHQMLQHQLDSMRSSAPPMESSEAVMESSAPPIEMSAPPAFQELNSNLEHKAPHQILQSQLDSIREREVEEGGNFQECLESLKEEDIVPFTESQLHALYHNVELEKNAEFVEHWLETQVIY